MLLIHDPSTVERMYFLKPLALMWFIVECVSQQQRDTRTKNKLNVLLITVDDMRPDLAFFGHANAPPTPNLDAFAASARTFRRAYAQVSTPSAGRK